MDDDELEGDFLNENFWFKPAVYRMCWEEFRKLPRHPAYRYEYRRGELTISGRPRQLNCRLPLETFPVAPTQQTNRSDNFQQTPLKTSSESRLVELFEQSFSQTFPYRHLEARERRRAAESQIGKAFHGSSWPVNDDASQILINNENQQAVAAAIITQVPDGNWSDFSDPAWQCRPAKDAAGQKWGVPHLTWIMVDARFQRRGLAALLLRHASETVRQQGHTHLFSTFHIGNHASMLWHWKQGFQLISADRPPLI